MMRMAWVRSAQRLCLGESLTVERCVKIIVALLVSFFWNYQLQRKFVYRDCRFDRFISSYKH